MKKILFFSLFFLTAISCFAQTYQTKNKVYIPANRKVTRTDKVLCDSTIMKGYMVKEEYGFQNKTSQFTVTKIDTLTAPKMYKALKKIERDVIPFEGWANLKSDEKDKSILHVNYWLNHPNTLSRGTIIKTHTRILQCDKTTKDTIIGVKVKTDSILNLFKVCPKDYDSISKTAWFKTCTQIIDVYGHDEDSSKIIYYLVDKYDRNADYTINLDNREFISFKLRAVDFGPIAIPFKYHFGYKKGTVEVDPEFQSDLNIGIFVGSTRGRYRQRFEGDELKDLAKLSVTLGGFMTFSTTALDSLSTIAGKLPFAKDDTKTIGVFSPGLGIMLTLYNFQFGIFGGLDLGMGKNAKNWNFNNRPWIGLGIAYNIKNQFFK